MTADRIILGTADDTLRPWLQLARPEHQDVLRSWRNAHAHRFYGQSLITPEDQKLWFAGYCDRPDDFMFVVMHAAEAIGCLGIRRVDDAWDVYNVIRGVASERSRGFMSQALRMVIEFALGLRCGSVRLEVLADNPAVAWYLRNGFSVAARTPEHLTMLHTAQGSLHLGDFA